MATVVIYGDRAPEVVGVNAEGDNLWLEAVDLVRASGWELKPEGVCKGDICVPIPPAREADFVRDGDRKFNLSAFARHLGQPVVHDDGNGVWFFGAGAAARRSTMASLEAPDFALPDLDGKTHQLSDYRGKKVLLAAWASW